MSVGEKRPTVVRDSVMTKRKTLLSVIFTPNKKFHRSKKFQNYRFHLLRELLTQNWWKVAYSEIWSDTSWSNSAAVRQRTSTRCQGHEGILAATKDPDSLASILLARLESVRQVAVWQTKEGAEPHHLPKCRRSCGYLITGAEVNPSRTVWPSSKETAGSLWTGDWQRRILHCWINVFWTKLWTMFLMITCKSFF